MKRLSAWLLIVSALSAPGVSAQLGPQQGPSLQAFLFGGVLFSTSDAPGPDGFRLGQMVAHASATLSERVVFFGEVSVSARASGYVLAMERAILRYEFNDLAKVSAGHPDLVLVLVHAEGEQNAAHDEGGLDESLQNPLCVHRAGVCLERRSRQKVPMAHSEGKARRGLLTV